MEMFGEGTSSRSSENDKMDRMMAMIEQVAKSQSEMRTQVIDISDRQARLEALPQSSQQVESPIQNPVQPQIPLVIQREEAMGEPVNNQVGKLLAEFNKLRPTTFGGSSDPNAAENWLLDMDSMGKLAPFQIRSYIEAVSKALSIEREDEDIQATRGQVGRIRQFPQQFQMRQDPNKRQVVPTSSGQLSYRPVRQQWQAVRPVVSQPGQPATRPSAPAQNNQFVPRGVQPPPVRPQGQMGFSAPQTQGTLYTIVTEDTPVEEMPQEDALFYAITQEDASASDQVVEDRKEIIIMYTIGR
ncbi:hypothetical protein BVC80_8063g1 [Macleaya cordata]|uniref:Uncharacterized protein n=1 Tax=Macleaya cordata TaxID=56857 RepID=A0A200Q052_MACCD|nr:hypothetical protein BVC80_8063g1 [Macleaya cordata]